MTVRSALVAATLLGLGCRDAVVPGTVDDLTTVVELDRTIIAPSDTLVVTVTIRNSTSSSIAYRSSCRAGVIRVYRNADRVDDFVCAVPESQSIRLLPGESFSTSIRWSIVTYRGGGLADTLPSGRYSVIGGVDVRGVLAASSAPVAIDVHAP